MRLAILFMVTALLAVAVPITDLYSTGDSRGVWTVNGAPAFTTATGSFPFPNWVESPGAKWISPRPSYADFVGDAPNTTFLFSTNFTIPDNFQSANINLRVATDNALLDVLLNGVSMGAPTAPLVLTGNTTPSFVVFSGTGFTTGVGNPMSLTRGFRPGTNTLTLAVRNSFSNEANLWNPVGVQALVSGDVMLQQGDPGTNTPEPSTSILVGAGLAAASLAWRRFAK